MSRSHGQKSCGRNCWVCHGPKAGTQAKRERAAVRAALRPVNIEADREDECGGDCEYCGTDFGGDTGPNRELLPKD